MIGALHIGRGLLQGDLIESLCKGYRIAIIADQGIVDLYGKPLAQKLGAELLVAKAKTREVKEQIEDQMLEAGLGRDTIVIGLGGGSTTDLAGFIAATYLRGVALILIPTTLLAMVDAAIGGKTAIDTPFGKNLIGALYFPKAIISDLDTLNTLPEKEMQNGFSEILKMGLISQAELIDTTDLEELVIKAAQAKISIVEQDPTETGLRRVLNFGHTIGHALESISQYTISHGEAVAMGCLAESYLSYRLGYLPKGEYEQIAALYQNRFKNLKLPYSYKRAELLKALSFDKKRAQGKVRFVLIDQIGNALPFDGHYCRPVEDEDLSVALNELERIYG